ncbi:MAG: DNA-3-methyladenine glycosylase I [Acidimicrobiia bacterium]
MAEPSRCAWPGDDPLLVAYHDTEWGVPVRDETGLFEALTLESAQAGLSWRTVLARRAGYRQAFAGFDADAVAAFGPDDVERLLADPGIIRHRGKVEATVHNARAVVDLRRSGGLAALVWDRVDGRTVVRRPPTAAGVPATDPLGDALAIDLAAAGFRFVGPTTAYAYCQAVGVIDDHLAGCPAPAGRDSGR